MDAWSSRHIEVLVDFEREEVPIFERGTQVVQFKRPETIVVFYDVLEVSDGN